MNEDIKFLHIYRLVSQSNFLGNARIEKEYIEAHMVRDGYTLCGASRISLVEGVTNGGSDIVKNRRHGVPVCKECEKKYKKIPSMWTRWVGV